MQIGKDKSENSANATKSEPRDYIVLGKRPDGSWRELGVTKGVTDKKAIAPHALEQIQTLDQEARANEPDASEAYSAFVAVPKRSWHPRQPRAKTDPQLSWT